MNEIINQQREEIERLKQRCAELEAKEKLTILTTHEATLNSSYGKKWLNKFALEQQELVIDAAINLELIENSAHTCNLLREKLRKEQGDV